MSLWYPKTFMHIVPKNHEHISFVSCKLEPPKANGRGILVNNRATRALLSSWLPIPSTPTEKVPWFPPYPPTWRAPIGGAGFSSLRGELFIGRQPFHVKPKRGARRILEAYMRAWLTVIGPVQGATVLHAHTKPLGSCKPHSPFHARNTFGVVLNVLGPS